MTWPLGLALASGPAALLLFWLASLRPDLVEAWYSRGWFAFWNPLWARITALAPFALIEVLVPLLLVAGVAVLFWVARGWLYDLAGLSVLVAWFVLGWGLNYQRLPWASTAHLEVRGGTLADLEALGLRLAATANAERPEVPARDDLYRDVVPAAKGAWSSPALSWLGIAGIYLPWTAEPLVNTGPPAWQLPFTAAHEAAHQAGWAREDEANFLAWLGLHDRKEPAARYAAALGALPYVAGALLSGGAAGADAWNRVAATLAVPVLGDWKAYDAWWRRYEGPVQKAAQAVNDTYLKSQGQADGVKSYGRMVDLLLAWESSSSPGRSTPPPPAPAP